MNSEENELRNHFFRTHKWELNRCLAPGMTCKAEAIRAHSVQNSNVLDLLCREGHVKALSRKIDYENGPFLNFEDVGRNRATTFSGFCSTHDAQIFKPIDSELITAQNAQHLFLLAYRAVARELHATMDGASKLQSAYRKRVDLGLDTGEIPELAGMMAVDFMAKSYKTFLYKASLDIALHKNNFDVIQSTVFNLATEQASIAVSSLFSLDGISHQDGELVRVALSVLPLTQQSTIVIFSYLPDDSGLVRNSLDRIFTATGYYQKYELSKLILNNCENFVVAPAYFDKWNREKTQSITNYFTHTLLTGDLAVEDQNLFLF